MKKDMNKAAMKETKGGVSLAGSVPAIIFQIPRCESIASETEIVEFAANAF